MEFSWIGLLFELAGFALTGVGLYFYLKPPAKVTFWHKIPLVMGPVLCFVGLFFFFFQKSKVPMCKLPPAVSGTVVASSLPRPSMFSSLTETKFVPPPLVRQDATVGKIEAQKKLQAK